MGAMFRAEMPGPDTLRLRTAAITRRPPGNVPYLVDNLWEWARPDTFPSRRFAAFASPLPAQAVESAGIGRKPYRVETFGKVVVLQASIRDSRFHPDCIEISKRLKQLVGQAWFDTSISEKIEIGRLFIPCLSKEEVEVIFATGVMREFRESLWYSVKFWHDVHLVSIDQPWPRPDGELFFIANKWRLAELANV